MCYRGRIIYVPDAIYLNIIQNNLIIFLNKKKKENAENTTNTSIVYI